MSNCTKSERRPFGGGTKDPLDFRDSMYEGSLRELPFEIDIYHCRRLGGAIWGIPVKFEQFYEQLQREIVRKLLKAIIVAVLVAGPGHASAQVAFEVMPTVEIPRNYESWSLFLICNPAWVLQNGDRGIEELFHAYKVFGEVIGPNNLAIWFWKTPAIRPTVENSDLGRMGKYCKKYELTASETPQVVATTVYPDLEDPGNRVVASLNGSAENSAHALADLTDQLLLTGLNQSGLDENERWRRISAAGFSALSSVACYFNKVSISIKTRVLNVEIAHTGQGNC